MELSDGDYRLWALISQQYIDLSDLPQKFTTIRMDAYEFTPINEATIGKKFLTICSYTLINRRLQRQIGQPEDIMTSAFASPINRWLLFGVQGALFTNDATPLTPNGVAQLVRSAASTTTGNRRALPTGGVYLQIVEEPTVPDRTGHDLAFEMPAVGLSDGKHYCIVAIPKCQLCPDCAPIRHQVIVANEVRWHKFGKGVRCPCGQAHARDSDGAVRHVLVLEKYKVAKERCNFTIGSPTRLPSA